PKAAEQLADFFPTHDRRNFVFPAWSHYPEHRPGTLQRVLIEEFYGAESNGGIGARDLALVGEEEKVLANLFLGQLIGRLPVMSGQYFYGRDVNLLGGGCEAVQLQIFNETLTERRHGVLSGKAGSNILGDGSLVGEIEPFLPESTLEKQLGQLWEPIRREPDLVQPAHLVGPEPVRGTAPRTGLRPDKQRARWVASSTRGQNGRFAAKKQLQMNA